MNIKMLNPSSCVECQSRYFDCEFDQNYNELDTNKNDHADGGLGAGNGAFNYGTVGRVVHLIA